MNSRITVWKFMDFMKIPWNQFTYSVEKWEFFLTETIFREIISLVIPLLSRNFCQKSVRENSRNFHNEQFAQCGNFGKWETLSHRKNISSNQLSLSSNIVTFTKFLPKMQWICSLSARKLISRNFSIEAKYFVIYNYLPYSVIKS